MKKSQADALVIYNKATGWNLMMKYKWKVKKKKILERNLYSFVEKMSQKYVSWVSWQIQWAGGWADSV